MEQPELGKKIAELRKQKGVTQEELVAKCNVTVRTIQRIESGDVTPRPSTIRLIVEALETDWNSFSKAFEKTAAPDDRDPTLSSHSAGDGKGKSHVKRDLTIAWIAGAIYFVIGFPEAAMEWELLESGIIFPGVWFYIVKGVTLIAFVLFMRGFIVLASHDSNTLLMFAAWIFLLITVVDYGMDIFSNADQLAASERPIGKALMYGCASMVFGVALFRSSRMLGSAAHYAGLLEMAVGLSFLSIVFFPVGLVLMIPAELLEIYLLFKRSESFKTNSGSLMHESPIGR